MPPKKRDMKNAIYTEDELLSPSPTRPLARPKQPEVTGKVGSPHWSSRSRSAESSQEEIYRSSMKPVAIYNPPPAVIAPLPYVPYQKADQRTLKKSYEYIAENFTEERVYSIRKIAKNNKLTQDSNINREKIEELLTACNILIDFALNRPLDPEPIANQFTISDIDHVLENNIFEILFRKNTKTETTFILDVLDLAADREAMALDESSRFYSTKARDEHNTNIEKIKKTKDKIFILYRTIAQNAKINSQFENFRIQAESLCKQLDDRFKKSDHDRKILEDELKSLTTKVQQLEDQSSRNMNMKNSEETDKLNQELTRLKRELDAAIYENRKFELMKTQDQLSFSEKQKKFQELQSRLDAIIISLKNPEILEGKDHSSPIRSAFASFRQENRRLTDELNKVLAESKQLREKFIAEQNKHAAEIRIIKENEQTKTSKLEQQLEEALNNLRINAATAAANTTAKIATLTQEKQQAIDELEADNRNKQKALKNLEADNKKKQKAIDELEADNEEKQKALKKLKADNEDKQQTIDELEANNRKKHKTIDELEANNRKKQQAIEELEANNRKKQQAIEELEANNRKKQQAIEELEANNRKKQQAIEELEATKAVAAAAAYTASQLSSANARIAALTQEKDKAMEDLKAAQAAAASTASQLATANARIAALTKDIDKYKDLNNTLNEIPGIRNILTRQGKNLFI